MPELNVVTGAFSYTGKYIAKKLLSSGKKVRTLTRHKVSLDTSLSQIEIFPFNFDRPTELIKSLEGASTLYNTYWIRFAYRNVTFDQAVENTKKLFLAAKEAGVRRVVHISVTNASAQSTLPYFRGKGVLEKILVDSNLSYAVIRPSVIFGLEDILINNMTWLLRRFPFFVMPGQGEYKLQPVYVEDVADIAVGSAGKKENLMIDAVGPEIYTFREMLDLISKKIQSRTKIISLNPNVALFLSKLIGWMIHDVLITKDEIKGLMQDLLISRQRPLGRSLFSEWFDQNKDYLGIKYSSELDRNYNSSVI